MTRWRLLLAAGVSVLAVAGCGGSRRSSTSNLAAVVTSTASTSTPPSSTTSPSTTTSKRTSGHTTVVKKPADRSATTSARTTPHPTAAAAHARSSTGSTTTTITTAAATPKSPVPCMVTTGLLHVGSSPQVGTWQGTDPASHRLIYVDGPYNSAAAARQAVTSLDFVSQAAAGGLWEVSASLRGGTGPEVHRVAACLSRLA